MSGPFESPTEASCDHDRLEDYLSGTCDVSLGERVERHLDRCSACRDTIVDLAADADFWDKAKENLDLQRDLPFDDGECDFSVSPVGSVKYVGVDRYLQIWLEESEHPSSVGRLNDYEIIAAVGVGGMGLVLRALDRSLGREVAIKTLRPHLTGSDEAMQRFSREAKLAASLRHRNVIPIYSVDTWRDVPYLVMPLVTEGSLRDHVRSKQLNLGESLLVAEQVASGLACAHADGMVHRDIKPSNILLLDGLDHVVITDFGLARTTENSTLTLSGVIAGTPQFMSPEQARGESVDTRSDLFSLGSLLYWMCSGASPFAANTDIGSLTRIVEGSYRPLHSQNPETPPWLSKLVDRLLAHRKEDRTIGSTEAAELLRRLLSHHEKPSINPVPPILSGDSNWTVPLLRSYARQSVENAGDPPSGEGSYVESVKHGISISNWRWLTNRFSRRTLGVVGGFAVFVCLLLAWTFVPKLAWNPASMEIDTRVQTESIDPTRPLDEQERIDLRLDLSANRRVSDWLDRLAALPVTEIPPEWSRSFSGLQTRTRTTVSEVWRIKC